MGARDAGNGKRNEPYKPSPVVSLKETGFIPFLVPCRFRMDSKTSSPMWLWVNVDPYPCDSEVMQTPALCFHQEADPGFGGDFPQAELWQPEHSAPETLAWENEAHWDLLEGKPSLPVGNENWNEPSPLKGTGDGL